jgi:hypothetical protein
VPSEAVSQAIGAPTGKIRLVSYSLCRDCQAIPDGVAKAEAKMSEEAARAMASSSPEMN